jgi:hypothetical protein
MKESKEFASHRPTAEFARSTAQLRDARRSYFLRRAGRTAVNDMTVNGG